MEKIVRFGPWLVIGVLVVVLVLQRSCGRLDSARRPGGSDTVRYTDTIRDTVEVVKLVGVPKPYEVVVPRDTFVFVGDSVECNRRLRELKLKYWAMNIYSDTLMNDTLALICITDTVSANKLRQRGLFFRNRSPTVINTTNIIQDNSRFKMFFGLSVGGCFGDLPQSRFSFGPSLLFVTKKDIATGIRYDVFNKIANVDFYWKLGFRRKTPTP